MGPFRHRLPASSPRQRRPWAPGPWLPLLLLLALLAGPLAAPVAAAVDVAKVVKVAKVV